MVRDSSRKYRFPWRRGNQFDLLMDGPSFFPAMLEAIQQASQYVWLEMYLFESGRVANRFIDALVQAAQRGVAVRVLIDDFGARKLVQRDRNRLCHNAASCTFYNPLRFRKFAGNMLRDHRKMLIVDGHTAFVGGAGISDAFDPASAIGPSWHETMIRVQGPVLADWQTLFCETWNRHARESLTIPDFPPAARQPDMLGRVLYGRRAERQEVKRAFLKRLRSAERRVWLATAYFIPSWKIRRALRKRARQGVDVRLLLPGRLTDHPGVRHASHRFYAHLLRHGVRIFEYQPQMLHSKVMLCDHWVSVGSSNLDRWNLRWNLEANQAVEDQDFAEQVRAMFEQDFRQCSEYSYKRWMRRSWWSRLSERFWGGVDLLLNRLRRNGGPE
jgi:phosphatidylserine/phosphatidylglycerophosphate/cardiolipin synthase-like enzyme